MSTMTIIGFAASILTAVCMLPQLFKIIREKRAENISYGMLVTLMTGLALWVVYGIMKEDWFIVISNSFSFIVNTVILILSWKYKR